MSEEKEYFTLDEAADYLDWNRATLYRRMKDFGIQTYRFKGDMKGYLKNADVQRLKDIKERPWLYFPPASPVE